VFSDRQNVELFHLQFVRLLCAGPDKGRFAIKGGCNLRFFFESVRYSEDLDLDVARLHVHTLKEKVTKILGGPALALPLKSRGIAVVESSAPKQTETTQRWKVALSAEGRSLPLHTKIEFSRRGTTEDSKVEPVAASVLAEYGLMPLLAPHYPLPAAIRQKIRALIHRRTVQARDVFDLSMLVAKAGGNVEVLRSGRAQIPKAIERCMEVSFDDYKAQVVSYLKPDQIEALGSREAWDALQSQVVEFLEKALR
jgi:predicted nucleotidyltransferase component of viral defense system